MNKVILIGNLARDPDYRTTPSGVPMCLFTIAVTRRFANQQGVREADFISCVAWRQQADFVHRFFTKGRKIGVVGFSVQGETLCLLDEDAQPLKNAIIWMDNRAGDQAAELRERFGDE